MSYHDHLDTPDEQSAQLTLEPHVETHDLVFTERDVRHEAYSHTHDTPDVTITQHLYVKRVDLDELTTTNELDATSTEHDQPSFLVRVGQFEDDYPNITCFGMVVFCMTVFVISTRLTHSMSSPSGQGFTAAMTATAMIPYAAFFTMADRHQRVYEDQQFDRLHDDPSKRSIHGFIDTNVIRELITETATSHLSAEEQRRLLGSFNSSISILAMSPAERDARRTSAQRASTVVERYHRYDDHAVEVTRTWLIELLAVIEALHPDRLHDLDVSDMSDVEREGFATMVSAYQRRLVDPMKARAIKQEAEEYDAHVRATFESLLAKKSTPTLTLVERA